MTRQGGQGGHCGLTAKKICKRAYNGGVVVTTGYPASLFKEQAMEYPLIL